MTTQITESDVREVVSRYWGWFMGLGVLLSILGFAAIMFPLVTTIGAKIAVGWVFLIGGIGQIFHAFSARAWKGFLASLLIGLLYVIVGGWLAFFPLTGIIGLTLLLAITFVVEGVFELGLGMNIRGERGSVWLIVSGIIAILAGLLIWAGLPSTATWAIGLLVGINILSSGLSFIGLAVASGRS